MLGDKIGGARGFFGLKFIGGFILGGLSVSTFVVTFGYLALFLHVPAPLLGFTILGILALSLLLALVTNHTPPRVTSLKLKMPGLKAHTTIVQLTDIHLNGLKRIDWVQHIVKTVNALSPDYIVFTGDLFDVSPAHIQPHIDVLALLKARKGKFAVSGNHDFYSGYTTYASLLNEMGFELIDNRHVDTDTLTFVGLSDIDGGRFGVPRPASATVLERVSRTRPIVLLDHRPEHITENLASGFNLQLSGHTHSGQLPPWNLLVRLRYRFAIGLHYIDRAIVYVSSGTGSWGPPLRLFSLPEITFISLH